MLILFDIDDTLLDDARATDAAVQVLHATLELREAFESFRQRWRDSLTRHFARYLARELSFQEQRRERIRDALQTDVSAPEADRLFGEYLVSYEENWRLFDDVLPCLEGLTAFRLGIVSNGNSKQQRRKLESTGILDRFSVVVGPEEAGVAKPHREIFLRACSLASVDPVDAVYVGDHHEADALAAVRAGLRGFWVNREGSRHDACLGVSCIRSLTELPETVHTWYRSKTL